MASWNSRWDFKRGIFRIWIIFAVLWGVVYIINEFPNTRNEFEHASLEEKGSKGLKPWEVYKLDELRRNRGCPSIFKKYSGNFSDEQFSLAVSEINIFECLPTEKSEIVYHFLLSLIGVPFAVLILGFSIFWAMSGFRKSTL